MRSHYFLFRNWLFSQWINMKSICVTITAWYIFWTHHHILIIQSLLSCTGNNSRQARIQTCFLVTYDRQMSWFRCKHDLKTRHKTWTCLYSSRHYDQCFHFPMFKNPFSLLIFAKISWQKLPNFLANFLLQLRWNSSVFRFCLSFLNFCLYTDVFSTFMY